MIQDTLENELLEPSTEKSTKKSTKKSKREKHQKLPKEISQEILKKMFKNLLKAVGIMLYFMVLNLAFCKIQKERLINDIEVFAGV